METETQTSAVQLTNRSGSSSRSVKATVSFAAFAVLLVALVTLPACRDEESSSDATTNLVTVAVAKVTREDLYNQVEVPAEFRPYVEVELHGKVSGYVQKMNVDFGDQVKAGQLLAMIEIPELGAQLTNAIANVQRAEADYTNAHLMYDRLQAVIKQNSNLVAQQDIDTAQAKDESALAAKAGAEAEVVRYQTLVNYTRITAPFDGVITHRYVDPGALIQGGTDSSSSTLLRISDNYRLRLDFPMSVKYVKDIHVGDRVEAVVESLTNKTFDGFVSRFTDRVNPDTRTMMVEVEVANPNLEVIPGMYAAVKLKVQSHPQVLTIPSEVVGGEQNPTVYIVNEQSEIEARPIKLGLETPEKYEVIEGLKEGESVMIGNRAFVHPGQKVETKVINPMSTP